MQVLLSLTTQFINAVSWIQQHSAACSFRFSSPLTRFLKDKFRLEIILQSTKVKLWLQWDDGASLSCCCCCNDNDGKDDDYNDAEDNNFHQNTKFLKIFFLVISSATDSGSTPLHLAASEGLLDCTEILVQAGADVSAKDSAGHTPLDLARIWCRREVAR